MSPRTGRPKSEKPKSTQLAVRLDNETLDKLDAVAKENSETRVETIRRGINKLYSELKNNRDSPYLASNSESLHRRFPSVKYSITAGSFFQERILEGGCHDVIEQHTGKEDF